MDEKEHSGPEKNEKIAVKLYFASDYEVNLSASDNLRTTDGRN